MYVQTIEDYCRAISKLDRGEGAKSTDLSKELGLSKITVAITLKKLIEDGFVNMKRYGRVRLFPRGKEIAQKMNFKHRVLESFFFKKLKMNKQDIHNQAHAIEHYASDELIEKLYTFIGKPKVDPHGQIISY